MPNEVLKKLGFDDRAISVKSKSEELSESQSIIIEQVREFGIDLIYFNTDENGNSFPAVFLKSVSSFDLNTLKEIAKTQRFIWNYKKVLFLYVYTENEIRIYNCFEKPINNTDENKKFETELKKIEIKKYNISTKDELTKLNSFFSRIAIDTGIIWTLDEAKDIREKINLQKRVDKYLVKSLVNTAKKLKNQGLGFNLINKIILRSLFLLYLEDRRATDEKLYSKIKEGAKTYFDILNDTNSTYKLFKILEKYFNGNVFTLDEDETISNEQLLLIKKCFISGDDNSKQLNLFDNWRLFDFSIIQIELLSEIYENFLFKTDPELKKKSGAYYTPPSLVEFILNEKLPIKKSETNYNLKILDPSCGSGIFLVESFKRLVKRYAFHYNKKLTDFDTLKKILEDNIFGIEIHPQAIKVAAFSLYLALVDHLDPKTLWQEGKHRLPNLINDPKDKSIKQQGNNLFCRDTISDISEIQVLKNFDLVVGNPPFGELDSEENDLNGSQKNIRNYCNNKNFPKEMVLPFLHKAIDFSPNGKIALIFTTKVLTKTSGTSQNFRKWLFNDCYVEKVYNFSILRNATKNFGGQLFGGATGPISIVYYQKEKPENSSNKILYYSPKTFIKSNILDGISIDITDLKYLPREECQKPDTKIWKIAMWGGMHDWDLIKNLIDKTTSLKEYFQDKNNSWIEPKVGLNGDSKKTDFIPKTIINPRNIQKYYTDFSATYENKKLYRKINKNLFDPPFVIMKKGQHDKLLTSSYIDYFAYCTTACYIFNGNVEPEFKKGLVSILNSRLTTYLLFLTSSSWGIEREQVFMDEVLESPALLPLLSENALKQIILLFDSIMNNLKINSIFNEFDFKSVEKHIDKIIIDDIFKFSTLHKFTIEDNLKYNLDLFENKAESKALLPAKQEQIMDYANLICSELNDFIEGDDLFANATVYKLSQTSPLMMIKISHESKKREIIESNEKIEKELKDIDKYLWKKEAENIYFRKKLNYTKDEDIYIIRPNQRRFWSQSMALEDASELILEILNEVHDVAK